MADLTLHARRWLDLAEHTSGDQLSAAQEGTIDALTGIGYALLDVAAAVREQTAALTGDDKRAILIERNQ